VPYAGHENARLWWERTGAGSPLLLINGLGSPSTTWHRLRPLLAAAHEVLTFDNRGVGRSSLTPGPYSVELMARDAVAVMDAAELPRAHVLGLSLGGLIAQELALSFPDRVASLVLVGTHAGIPTAAPEEMDMEAVTALSAAAGLPPEERMRSLTQFLHSDATPASVIAEDLDVRAQYPTSQEAFTAQMLGAATWTRMDELGRLQAPTLVLHGQADRLVPLLHGRRLADAIPQAVMAVVPDAGHELFTDQPQTAASNIVAFLAAVDRDAERLIS
jgi:3-oxoadipate enol-lactonase